MSSNNSISSDIQVIIFTIKELYNAKATSGGATFHITVGGATTRSICHCQDQFNGDYTVCVLSLINILTALR